MLRGGEVCLPGEDGPVPARTESGGRYDPFEVVDRLTAQYALVYLVDLDGVEHAEPQLDFLQELARGTTLWVDGGVRTADQAIDILVAGARRAVLSTAMLRGMRELRRTWRLSTELVFEVEMDARGVVAPGEWESTDPAALLGAARALGLDRAVVSPRGIEPDWGLISTLTAGGPTWVDGSFERNQLAELRRSRARGGIFHLDRQLISGSATPSPPGPLPSKTPRDDET
jgi:hypothetical protein